MQKSGSAREVHDVARIKVYDVAANGCANERTLLPQPTPPNQPHPNMKQLEKT